MEIVYTGRHAAIDVPSVGIENAERGVTIDVPDEVGQALVKASDWKKAATTKPANDGAKNAGKEGN